MSFFQKVGNWLADRENGSAVPAEEPEQETSRTPLDPFGNGDEEYGGRVPYRSTNNNQESTASRRRWQGQRREEAPRQPVQEPPRQQEPQPQGMPGMPPQGAAPQAVPQNAQQPGGWPAEPVRHVEYVVLLRSRAECKDVIAYIKANASVFLNMEFIPSDAERQRCVDMLSGAAYTLGCAMNKISPRGIYLISAPTVQVVLDPAITRYAAAADTRSAARPAAYSPNPYAAQSNYGSHSAAPEYSAPAQENYPPNEVPVEPRQEPAQPFARPQPTFAPGTPTMRFRAQDLQGAPGSFGTVMTGAPAGYGRYQNGQKGE